MKICVNEGSTLHTPKGVFRPGEVCDLADGEDLIARGLASRVNPEPAPAAESGEGLGKEAHIEDPAAESGEPKGPSNEDPAPAGEEPRKTKGAKK